MRPPSASAAGRARCEVSRRRSHRQGAPQGGPPPARPDIAKLRADYDRLRDELFRARSRAQIVEEGVYTSKLGATLRWKGAPDFILHRAEVRLDGTAIWDSGDKPLVDELIKVAERAIKPGPHALTLRLEVRPGKKTQGQPPSWATSPSTPSRSSSPTRGGPRVAITGDEDGDPPEYEPEIEVERSRVEK